MSRFVLYSYLAIVFILSVLHSLVSMSRSAPVDFYPSTIYDGTLYILASPWVSLFMRSPSLDSYALGMIAGIAMNSAALLLGPAFGRSIYRRLALIDVGQEKFFRESSDTR